MEWTPAWLIRGLMDDLGGTRASSARPLASPAMPQLLFGGTSHVAQSDSPPAPPFVAPAIERVCIGTPSISDRSVIDMSLSKTSRVMIISVQSVTNMDIQACAARS
jgi:hypothetical protein